MTIAPDGSAKPVEVARALGLAGGDAPSGARCRHGRLGFVGPEMPVAALPIDSVPVARLLRS